MGLTSPQPAKSRRLPVKDTEHSTNLPGKHPKSPHTWWPGTRLTPLKVTRKHALLCNKVALNLRENQLVVHKADFALLWSRGNNGQTGKPRHGHFCNIDGKTAEIGTVSFHALFQVFYMSSTRTVQFESFLSFAFEITFKQPVERRASWSQTVLFRGFLSQP